MNNHFLSIILFTPLAGALILLLINKQNENAIRWIANIVTLIGFLISVPLWFWYQPSGADFQFVERAPWIPSIGAEYFLGVDGLSTLLILLTTMMGFAALMISTERGLAGLGLLLTLGVGCCMLTALVFLPAVLHLLPTAKTTAEAVARKQAA